MLSAAQKQTVQDTMQIAFGVKLALYLSSAANEGHCSDLKPGLIDDETIIRIVREELGKNPNDRAPVKLGRLITFEHNPFSYELSQGLAAAILDVCIEKGIGSAEELFPRLELHYPTLRESAASRIFRLASQPGAADAGLERMPISEFVRTVKYLAASPSSPQSPAQLLELTQAYDSALSRKLDAAGDADFASYLVTRIQVFSACGRSDQLSRLLHKHVDRIRALRNTYPLEEAVFKAARSALKVSPSSHPRSGSNCRISSSRKHMRS